MKNVLIANSPNGRKGWLLKMFLLDKTVIAIVEGKGAHAVEHAASAIQKYRLVAIAFENARDGLDIARTIPFDDRIAGERRKRGKDAFKSAHGAVAGSIKVRVEHAIVW